MKKFIIFIAAVAMVGAFVATAMADVDLYGSARFRTYYWDVDPGGSSKTDQDLEWQMGHLSRFGANFKSDKITGKVEIDARVGGAYKEIDDIGFRIPGTSSFENSNGASGIGNIRLRLLWGEYDFGTWKFMIGQNYPLYDAPVSGINFFSGGLQKFGGIGYDVARTSQMRFTIGDLRIAFLPTDTATAADPDVDGDVDVKFPKVEVRYGFKFDMGKVDLIAGYQTFDFKGDVDGDSIDDNIDSWVLAARGELNFGPAYLGLGLTYRQNGTPYGAWTVSSMESPCIESGSFQDATAFGIVGALGYKINDMFTLEASYAKLTSEQDTTLTNEDDAQAYGLMAKITVAPGFYIIPEIIFQDNEDKVVDGSKSDQGDATYFGVFWRIDFK